jgi:hypothetical protein
MTVGLCEGNHEEGVGGMSSPTRWRPAEVSVSVSGLGLGLERVLCNPDRADVTPCSRQRARRPLLRHATRLLVDEDEHARKVVIAVDNALSDVVRDAVGDGALTPAIEAQVAAVERAISVAASLVVCHTSSETRSANTASFTSFVYSTMLAMSIWMPGHSMLHR